MDLTLLLLTFLACEDDWPYWKRRIAAARKGLNIETMGEPGLFVGQASTVHSQSLTPCHRNKKNCHDNPFCALCFDIQPSPPRLWRGPKRTRSPLGVHGGSSSVSTARHRATLRQGYSFRLIISYLAFISHLSLPIQIPNAPHYKCYRYTHPLPLPNPPDPELSAWSVRTSCKPVDEFVRCLCNTNTISYACQYQDLMMQGCRMLERV